nr:hypothetical protein [uncultured Sphingomonas sp.]
MNLEEQLWRTSDGTRHFILPDVATRPPGPLVIRSLAGDEAAVDPGWLGRYEVTENEAHAWAKQEFGIALGEIRRRIDAKLGRMRTSLDAAKRTPARREHDVALDALPALLSLAKALPRAILDGLSGDPARVTNAHDALDGIGQRLNHAGIAVGDRLSVFPDRLAGLRAEIGRSRAGASPPSPDDQGEDRS